MSNKHNIILNYPEIRIDNPQIITDNLGKISIQSTFIGKPNEPNVIYSANSLPQNFQAEKLYIYSRIHDLTNLLKTYKQGLDYDGELIIKNKSHTTQQVIYTIFLLKTQESSIFTDFISNMNKSSLYNESINELLKHPTKSTYLDITGHSPDTYLVYSDNATNQTVIIDTNVINVSQDLSKYSNIQTLFRVNQNYEVVKPYSQPTEKTAEKSVEGFSLDLSGTLMNDNADGDYLICDNLPIGSSEELNYMIPQSSGIVDTMAENGYMKTIINYTLCFCIFIFVYISSPVIYKFILMYKSNFPDKLESLDHDNVGITVFSNILYDKNPMTLIAYIISLVILTISIIFLTVGPTQNLPILTGFGIGIVLSYIVAVLAIKNNPLQKIIQSLLDHVENTGDEKYKLHYYTQIFIGFMFCLFFALMIGLLVTNSK